MFTERSLEFQKSQIGPHLHLSLSRCSVFPPPAVRRRWTSSTVRPRPNGPGETSPRHLARPLAPSHAHTRPRPLPEPPRHPQPCAAPLPLRPLAVDSPRAKSTAPSHSIPHPGALWPIKTPRTPQSRPFFPFFLLPPLRHGRRDPALADRLAQPHIAPSDHRSSFATSQLSSTRAESNPNPLPKPFPFCAAAGELRLTADRPAPGKTEPDSYPRSIHELTRCSCVPCSTTPSPPSPPAPANRTTDPPSTPTSSNPCTKPSNVDQGRCFSILSLPRASPWQPR